MALYPVTTFSSGAVPSVEEALLDLAEYITTNITPASVSGQQQILVGIQQTLLNAIHLIDAYQIQLLMSQEYSLLSRIEEASLGLDSSDAVLVANRLASFNDLVNTIYPLSPWLTFNLNNLASGQSALPVYDLISYYMQFNFETIPSGLTFSNFDTEATAMATAWGNVVTYLGNNGTSFQVTAYDPSDRMYLSSEDVATFVSNVTFPTSTQMTLSQAWNLLVALPSLLRVASLLFWNPASAAQQAIIALKFLIFQLIYQTNTLLTSFNIPSNIQQPQSATLRAGESLLDFSARTTGTYSNWESIASANNLLPPYVGTSIAPNIAVPGDSLYLPPYPTVPLPLGDYAEGYLGTDINIGIPGANNNELTTWTGDFSLISGIPNLSSALYRRVLTPLGSLIYHTTYGSPIPAAAGNISTANEAGFLLADLRNTILSDPRVSAVNQITAYAGGYGSIILTALLTPFGINQIVPFNLVLVPQTASVTGSSNQ